MPMKPQEAPPPQPLKRDRGPETTAIGDHVMRTLGRPRGPYRVQVRPLWPDHYRVNVFIGDTASIRLAHSYFLVVDGEGNIVESTPKITRQY